MSKKSHRLKSDRVTPATPIKPRADAAHLIPEQELSEQKNLIRGFTLYRPILKNIRDFCGLSTDTTYLWSRWLVIRAIGLVYIIVFAGVIRDQMALAGPSGIIPIADYLKHVSEGRTGTISAFFAAPSLFWISSGEIMIRATSWLGLAAALAVMLNLWPRIALFTCWLTFLSFVATWHAFSPAQLDDLMLESALLLIPFAPRGIRPGLGEHSPPAPLVIFMVRWLLFRVMFESGLVKLTSGDPHWRDFSAMEVMYETSPFPTILGYLDHQMPHFYHVGEILFTFTAELVAPVLAVFGGRRGRWIAIAAWTIFQTGIQLTNNFGWLNTASIGLGLLLLDDQMVRAAAEKLRLPFLIRWIGTKSLSPATPALSPSWQRHALGIGLWVHFALSVLLLAKVFRFPLSEASPILNSIVNAVRPFGSVNAYTLYAEFDPIRYQVEFLGSNDGGRTWRPYEYQYIPQNEHEISPFIAPWFARFDASLQIAVFKGKRDRLLHVVATHLLAGNSRVIGLFQRNPFPDSRPTLLRMHGYRLRFTDLTILKQTGRYWTKELAGEYLPPIRLDASGRIVPFDLSFGENELRRGNRSGAVAFFAKLHREGSTDAGFRLVDCLMRGSGAQEDHTRAFSILTDLAKGGEIKAEHAIGVSFEHGIGVAADMNQAERWYRTAASHGYAAGYFSLGALYANDRLLPRNDAEALAALIKAAEMVSGEDPIAEYIRQKQPALVRKLEDRMTTAEIRAAQTRTAR